MRQAAKQMERDADRLETKLLFREFGEQVRALQRAEERSTKTGRASLAGVAAEAKALAAAASRTGRRVEHKALSWADWPGAPTMTEALDEQLVCFSGYLAVFGNEDMIWANPATNGDIIEPGAFTKTLAEMEARQATRRAQGVPSGRYLMPIFWEHDDRDPIGGFTSAATRQAPLLHPSGPEPGVPSNPPANLPGPQYYPRPASPATRSCRQAYHDRQCASSPRPS
jgi:Caudovirus prohead serine protease